MSIAAKTFEIEIQQSPVSAAESVDFENLPFGKVFTDHMFVADYMNGQWVNCIIKPLADLSLHPATAVLHYGQGIFEGMKAFKNNEGEVQIFRPHMNFDRMNVSAARMAMPPIPEELFMEALTTLVRMDSDWIPDTGDGSLYIRPFMFAADEYVGIKPSDNFKLIMFCCPVSKYYQKPVRVYMSDKYVRAFPGGTGAVKAIGNYGATMMPLREIRSKGYDQILWLDGISFSRIQEIGTMNVFLVIDNVVLTVPTTEGTILEGITRDSCITLLKDRGYKLEIRDITVEEIISALKSGRMQDAFGAGTAATVAPIGEIGYKDQHYILPDADTREISNWLKNELWGIRKGLIEDKFGWMQKV
ncbi:MAG: branched-chain amino acid aminotransferase [Chitinophagales bacterium]|nr:branched-chain amino acid aminotransferase [Chitinophagales bacterium]